MDAKDYHILFPIQQKALNENSNLKQNPGYEN
ncbi:RagB/SusD family nutrient uptake outer membrane protein [Phocaeicola vulgatus]|nr:RagB/SusD family nutrient uptake outer membrane protein [Phocaeicola vulgatus]MDE8712292.1 RagB/SusD family nutrient uptake outer membrane protein [Phocaeicola vulgatus]